MDATPGEYWMSLGRNGTAPPAGEAPISYLATLQVNLHANAHLALEELSWSEEGQLQWCDDNVWPRSFQPGQRVLLLLPSTRSKLLMGWQGPYEVLEWVGDMDYHIRVPCQGRHLYHIDLFKGWQEQEDPSLYNAEIDWDKEGKERTLELHATREPTSARPHHQI